MDLTALAALIVATGLFIAFVVQTIALQRRTAELAALRQVLDTVIQEVEEHLDELETLQGAKYATLSPLDDSGLQKLADLMRDWRPDLEPAGGIPRGQEATP